MIAIPAVFYFINISTPRIFIKFPVSYLLCSLNTLRRRINRTYSIIAIAIFIYIITACFKFSTFVSNTITPCSPSSICFASRLLSSKTTNSNITNSTAPSNFLSWSTLSRNTTFISCSITIIINSITNFSYRSNSSNTLPPCSPNSLICAVTILFSRFTLSCSSSAIL